MESVKCSFTKDKANKRVDKTDCMPHSLKSRTKGRGGGPPNLIIKFPNPSNLMSKQDYDTHLKAENFMLSHSALPAPPLSGLS